MGPESEKSQMLNRAIRKQHLDQNGAKAIEKLFKSCVELNELNLNYLYLVQIIFQLYLPYATTHIGCPQ